jgi:hypothetical protein
MKVPALLAVPSIIDRMLISLTVPFSVRTEIDQTGEMGDLSAALCSGWEGNSGSVERSK